MRRGLNIALGGSIAWLSLNSIEVSPPPIKSETGRRCGDILGRLGVKASALGIETSTR